MAVLGLNEFLRNLKVNIIAIIQMAILFVVVLVASSTCYEQYRLYNGIMRNVDETGVVLYPFTVNTTDTDFRNLLDVEKIVYSESTSLLDKNEKCYDVYTYMTDITYSPYVKEGVWCESGSQKDGVIRVCIADDFPLAVGIGDTFEVGGLIF